MISSLEIENIRVFEDGVWNFPLKPMSIFCGTNSSGKSTLLKTLLLLRQSMGISENFQAKDGKLRFIGSQIDLGDYKCFVAHNDIKRNISIAIVIKNLMPIRAAQILDENVQHSKENNKGEKAVGYSLRSLFQFGVRENQSSNQSSDSQIGANREVFSDSPRAYLTYAKFELSIKGKNLLVWELQYSGLDEDGNSEFNLFIPEDYFYKDQDGLPKLLLDSESRPGFVKLSVSLSGLTPSPFYAAQFLPKDSQNDKENSDKRWGIFPLPSVIDGLTDHLKKSLGAIDYIGPLRSPAKRYYLSQFDAIPNIDPSGEFLPFVLRDINRYEAWYIPPKAIEFTPRKIKLVSALNTWLHYIRTGEITSELDTEEISLEITKALFEVRIKSALGNELHALTDSGFGYSQLLPIIARALIAKPLSTVIIEQPELHLNPALQVRISEFLMAMALGNKQIIIETHSEHVVNTIRVLTAEDETEKLSKLCKIFYIDASLKRPVVQELSIQPDGTIPKWPQQFFGEAASLTGRLLRAQKRFKKQPKQA